MTQFLDIYDVWSSPSVPKVGDRVTISAQTVNIGDAGSVGAEIWAGNSRIFKDSKNVASRSAWSISASFVIQGVTSIVVKTFHYSSQCQGFPCIKDKEFSLTLTPGSGMCRGAQISRNKSKATSGEVVNFTLWRTPATAGITGNLIETINGTDNIIGSCVTGSSGTCYVDWTSKGPGYHQFYSKFDGCNSAKTFVEVTDPTVTNPPIDTPPDSKKTCKEKDPLKIGCIGNIPITYIIIVLMFMFMMMS